MEKEKILCAIVIYLQFSIGYTDKYKTLPPVYKMEDYNVCLKGGGLYCKADLSLINTDSKNNTLWKLIKESMIDKYSHDRSIIHRGVCVTGTDSIDFELVRKVTEIRVNEELKDAKLLAKVQDIKCTEGVERIELTTYDKVFLFVLLFHLFCVMYGTIYDKWKRKDKCTEGSIVDKILMSFSLISNWKKLSKVEGNEDYNKLKSIQGVRFYNMFVIIAAHTYTSYSLVYLKNPEEIGNNLRDSRLDMLFILTSLLVQTFFLISSWILTYQIYNYYRDYGEFTVKNAFTLLINRYFRFGVCIIILTSFLKLSWYRLFDGAINFDVAEVVQTACIRNQWRTVFFVNNNLFFGDMCYPPSWYLSVDFQMYAATIVTIYVVLKFKLNEWRLIGVLLFVSSLLYGLIVYLEEMGIFFKPDANFFRTVSIYQSVPLRIFHTSTYSCWSTSLVGILFGIVYTKNKYRKIDTNLVLSTLWLLGFFGLPCLMFWLTSNELKGITAAMLAPFVKPLFSVGTGIGILGMSHGIGGIIKRLCVNRFVVLMSNFSFSIYIFQFLFIFSKGFLSTSPLEYSINQLLKSFLLVDAPLSVIGGIIGALILEQPGINLQKVFLPQLSPQKPKPKEDKYKE